MENPKEPSVFLKWAGGKRQILSSLVRLSPKKFDRYIEPFIGGGIVFFNFREHNRAKKYFISDTNEELINAFKVVKKNPGKLIEKLREHKENFNRDRSYYYYKVRKTDPGELTDIDRAARLIFLNKTCFNGLYRVNSKGEFNVPMGVYKNPDILNEPRLRKASRLLRNTSIRKSDFAHVLKVARKGDFVYFDPPYQPLTKTSSFTSYTKDSFGQKDQEKLADTFRELDGRGCFVMLSNSDSKFVRKLYRGFRINVTKARRAINCKGDKRGPINELIITNY